MSLNSQEQLSASYSCAAAYSVWIPKPPEEQKNEREISPEKRKRKYLIQGYCAADSYYGKNIGTPKTNRR